MSATTLRKEPSTLSFHDSFIMNVFLIFSDDFSASMKAIVGFLLGL